MRNFRRKNSELTNSPSANNSKVKLLSVDEFSDLVDDITPTALDLPNDVNDRLIELTCDQLGVLPLLRLNDNVREGFCLVDITVMDSRPDIVTFILPFALVSGQAVVPHVVRPDLVLSAALQDRRFCDTIQWDTRKRSVNTIVGDIVTAITPLIDGLLGKSGSLLSLVPGVMSIVTPDKLAQLSVNVRFTVTAICLLPPDSVSSDVTTSEDMTDDVTRSLLLTIAGKSSHTSRQLLDPRTLISQPEVLGSLNNVISALQTRKDSKRQEDEEVEELNARNRYRGLPNK